MSTEKNFMFNVLFMKSGWVPVSLVADVLGVTRMTIHRRIEAGDFGETTSDAHVTYVKLKAVRAAYKSQPVLDAQVDLLEKRIEKILKEEARESA